jgi:hypothetical protein
MSGDDVAGQTGRSSRSRGSPELLTIRVGRSDASGGSRPIVDVRSYRRQDIQTSVRVRNRPFNPQCSTIACRPLPTFCCRHWCGSNQLHSRYSHVGSGACQLELRNGYARPVAALQAFLGPASVLKCPAAVRARSTPSICWPLPIFSRLPGIPAYIAMNVMASLHADAYFRPK